MRLPERPAVRDRGICVQELQRRDSNKALPDRFLVRVADRPRLVESRQLPLRVRHDPAVLVWKIDPRGRAEAQHAGVLRDRVRTYTVATRRERRPTGQGVEVDVARVSEPSYEVERAVGAPVV